MTRMPLWRFTALTALGSGAWNAVFVYAGYRLGVRWEVVAGYVQPVSHAVALAVAAALVILAGRTARRRLATPRPASGALLGRRRCRRAVGSCAAAGCC